MADSINFHHASVQEILSLDNIRASLQRMEESIVFRLIERAQFAYNACVYQDGAFPELREKEHWTGSWLAWSLRATEAWHAKLGRWLAPDEHPFTPLDQLPEPVLAPNDYPEILHPHRVNVTHEIVQFYTQDIVPQITIREGRPLNDRQYGSSVVCDIEALSAIAHRIYFGMFVSESKFRADPAAFIPAIQTRDTDALASLITKPAAAGARPPESRGVRPKPGPHAPGGRGAQDPVGRHGPAVPAIHYPADEKGRDRLPASAPRWPVARRARAATESSGIAGTSMRRSCSPT